MQTHLEQHLGDAALEDIQELQEKIQAFKEGRIPEDKFKAYRLTRGVYGQRQQGVQMFRTKIPYGKLTSAQLVRLADISERFATGNLHLTTRQNIQMHYVKLEDSPQIWTLLESAGITAREACGNTVRNITASAMAGIDPEEPFDVTPYVRAVFSYFLRNPICQDMGRKVKIAFSSSEKDSAFTYFHDFGFIPRVQEREGESFRGFKVVVGGGLGAQSILAQTAYEFLPADQLIPYLEAGIRVFDRYGERTKRFKARMKYLIKDLGLEAYQALVEQEKQGLAALSIPLNFEDEAPGFVPPQVNGIHLSGQERKDFELWRSTNVTGQKQGEWVGVSLRVPRGDIHADTARKLAKVVKRFAADDLRVTVNQGLLMRHVHPDSLPALYLALKDLDLHLPGFDGIADVTACPGTDTCNLAVTNSTSLAAQLESMVWDEFPQLIGDPQFKIKISGCMNSCGQHMAAAIGLHGSSIKVGKQVVPAMQVVLAGGVGPDGVGYIGEKVIKLPTKRIPLAVAWTLNDYLLHSEPEELFLHYFQRQDKRYFYDLLKPLADKDDLRPEDYRDWGHEEAFVPEVGVGECAGVMFDLVGSIIQEAEERLASGDKALASDEYGHAAYWAYSAMVIGAKALLLAKEVQCNTHMGIIRDFDKEYVQPGILAMDPGFEAQVLRIQQETPGPENTPGFLGLARDFLLRVVQVREGQLRAQPDKPVIDNYYKA